ncbi:hypothetical protein LOTGIDRAFT_234511 [Lottia gigantea]|uniref:Ubiquitin carboxyl-terminal hydrolase n=1 Tax=Lottia gigantea TaxID=225164 RepID=V4A5C6_LOTGI|nr:hypothetical protein LOTGIDRAFT_234511 [Lottia gigantea]ESO88451.1 hypothetical protein LOTGIDRAFT_234511 [Lottia gigantea]
MTYIILHKNKNIEIINHEYDDMDSILEGILKSDHPEGAKRTLFKKIVEKGAQPHASNMTLPVLNLTSKWFLDGENDLKISAGWEIFVSWAKHNQPCVDSFFSRDYLVSLLTTKYKNEANPPLVIHQCMRIVPNKSRTNSQKIIEASAIKFIQEHIDTVCLRNFVIFLEEYKDCVPKGKYRLKFCESLIEGLSKGKTPENQNEVMQFVKDVARIVQFIHHLWQSGDASLVLDCLKNVFYILCDVTSSEEPSDCLGSLLTCVPNDVCNDVIKQAVKTDMVDNDAMTLALQRMVNWLNWPACINIDQIVIMFLKELATHKKYTVLISVTESKIESVMEKLQYAPVRDASFKILSHMLLSFQHSAIPFHKIIPQVKGTVAVLRKEKTKESLECLSNLAELLYCLMSHHTGFPDLYEPLIEMIKMYPEPSEDVIQMKLAESKWGGTSSASLTDVSGLQKSETGKIGLLNLGNSCYMNSIIQTLYMCDEFRQGVLTHPIRSPGNILSKLQEVFAFLAKSHRPAIAPSSFLDASRPPWFTNGCQQDCSEFLKYLLDQMHEQEKMKSITQGSPNKTIIEDTFGGKMSSTVRCLKCKHESTKVEDFIDIPLAFPHNTSSSKQLVGGSSEHSITTVEQEQKMDASADKSGPLHLNDLVKHYLQTEKLTGDNKYHCDHCKGLQEGESNIKIEQSPQYLVLTLLRFSYDVKLQCRSKIFREVKYPETLVLPIQTKKSPEQTSKRMKPNNVPSDVYKTLMGDENSVIGTDKEVYGLCSVIVHSGASSECGHYYCYSRHSSPTGNPHISDNVDKIDFLENKWHLFNDCRVSYTSYDSFSNVTKRFNRDTAYVLVYRKISPSEFEGQQTIVKEPSIISKLRADIDKDNSKYLQEQDEANKYNTKTRERSSSTSSYYSRRDGDDEPPPPDCGGSSGLDSLDTVGARFIF